MNNLLSLHSDRNYFFLLPLIYSTTVANVVDIFLSLLRAISLCILTCSSSSLSLSFSSLNLRKVFSPISSILSPLSFIPCLFLLSFFVFYLFFLCFPAPLLAGLSLGIKCVNFCLAIYIFCFSFYD